MPRLKTTSAEATSSGRQIRRSKDGRKSGRGHVPQSASKYLIYDLHINALEHPKDLPREKFLDWQLNAFRKIMENNEMHLGRKSSSYTDKGMASSGRH